jgi:hypothetical protein
MIDFLLSFHFAVVTPEPSGVPFFFGLRDDPSQGFGIVVKSRVGGALSLHSENARQVTALWLARGRAGLRLHCA